MFYLPLTLNALKFPNDSGPIYKETLAGRFPVEPFNTYSNLIFLFIVVYFGLKVYKDARNHKFLAFVLPVIALSYVGGTIYHGTRSHQFWLQLDYYPIILLSLLTAFYFIYRWLDRWSLRIGLFLVMLGLYFGLRALPLPKSLQISLGYLIMAMTILLPVFGYLVKTKWKNYGNIIAAFGVFFLAVFFRFLDKRLDMDFFWMGTHWLWHLMGGVAVFFLMQFIFEDKKVQAAGNA